MLENHINRISGGKQGKARPCDVVPLEPRKMNNAPAPLVYGTPDRGLRRWLLPMFLTVVPLLVLLPTIREERQQQRRDQERRLVAATDPVVARFREAATLKFWAAQTARRLVRSIERRLTEPAGTNGPSELAPTPTSQRRVATPRPVKPTGEGAQAFPPSPPQPQDPALRSLSPRPPIPPASALTQALADLGDRYRLAGIPPVRLWAFALPAPGQTAGQVQALTGPGLETAYRRVFGQLFQALATAHQTGEPLPRRVFQIFQETFGPGVTRETLSPANRGMAFPVLFQGRFSLLVWDLWFQDARPMGGFFLVMDRPPTADHLAIELAVRHWRRLVGRHALWPACFLFPGLPLPDTPRRIIHPAIAEAGLTRALHRLARSLWVRQATDRLGQVDPHRWPPSVIADSLAIPGLSRTDPPTPTAIASSPPGLAPSGTASPPVVLGRLVYPLRRLDRFLPLGAWLTRLVALGPDAPYFAILVMPRPGASSSRLTMIWQALFIAWAGGWAMFFSLAVGRKRLPQPSVALQLAGWILCLMGLAGVLLLTSQRRLLQDLEARLIDQASQRMQEQARTLEGEAARLTWRQGRVCDRILRRPAFQEGLIRDRLATAAGVSAPGATRPTAPRKKASAEIRDGVAPRIDHLARAWAALHREGLSPQILAAVGSGGYVLATFSASIAPEEQPPLLEAIRTYGEPFITQEQGWLASDPARFSIGQFFSNDRGYDLRNPGTVGTAVLGGRRFCRLHQFVRHQGRILLYLVVFWEGDQEFPAHLRRLLRLTHGRRGLEAAVFRRHGIDLQTIAAAGRVTMLRASAREDTQKPRLRREPNGEFLQYLYPSPVLKGYTFAVRQPLAPVFRILREEERSFLRLIFLGLPLLLVLGALALHGWLARPIQDLATALGRIDAGDFTARLDLVRGDELGQAATAFDRVAAGLQERDRMSRFVTANVLEAIRADGPAGAAPGRRGPVIMLFADIRGFTTLSEAHPPEAIFAALNRHFEVLSPCVHREGGLIERFIGDAIQAVFEGGGAPTVDRALRAALAMRRAWQDLQAERRAAGAFVYDMGIGLASGDGITGVVGDARVRQDVVVLGPPVGEAAAMEALTKVVGGTAIICSEAVKAQAGPGWRFGPVPGHPQAWILLEGTGEPAATTGALQLPIGEGTTAGTPPTGVHPVTRTASPLPTNPNAGGTPSISGTFPCPPASRGGSGMAWNTFLAASAFWLLALALMSGATRAWQKDLQAHRVRETDRALRQDLVEIRKTSREQTQVALLLRELFHAVHRRSGSGASAPPPPRDTAASDSYSSFTGRSMAPLHLPPQAQDTMPRRWEARATASETFELGPYRAILERLRRRWPSLTWAIVRSGPLPLIAPSDAVNRSPQAAISISPAGSVSSSPPDPLLLEIWACREEVGMPPRMGSFEFPLVEAARARGWSPRRWVADATYAERIIDSSPTPPPLLPWQLVHLAATLERFRGGKTRSMRVSYPEMLLLPTLGEHPLHLQDLVVESAGGFRSLRLGGQELLFFWEFIPTPGRASLLLFLPPDALDYTAGLHAMIERLGRAGTVLSVTPFEADRPRRRPRGSETLAPGATRSVSLRLFPGGNGTRQRRLHQLGRRLQEAVATGRRLPGWVIRQGVLETDRQRFRVLAARRLPPAEVPPWPLRLGELLSALWLGAGLLAGAWLLIRRAPLQLSLRPKLAAAFLCLLLPTLVVSSAVFGRSALAQIAGTEAREGDLLEQDLRRSEDAYEALLAWNSRLLRGLLHQPSRLPTLLGNSPAAGPTLERPTSSPNDPAIMSLYDELLSHGAVAMGIGVGGPGIPARSVNAMAVFWGQEDQGRLLVPLLKKSLRALHPEAGRGSGRTAVAPTPARDDLLAEEVFSTLTLISTGEFMADVLHAPWALCRMDWGMNTIQVFRAFLPLGPRPHAVLWVIWDYRWVILPLAEGWQQTFPHRSHLDYRLAINTSPNVTFVHPYLTFWPVGPGKRWAGFREFVSYDPPEVGRLLSTARHSGETVTRILGQGKEARLVLARQSAATLRFILFLSTPIGHLWADLRRQAELYQWFLAALLVGSLILARLMAARFLGPLEAFSQAAGAVAAGNYRVGLRLDRTDEFGAVAVAFNRLCRSLDEGRLLRRFVSESVRRAARDDEQAEEARRGRHREAVILFAGTAHLAEGRPDQNPGEILAGINAFLARGAQIIRRHDGEIDKFLGEKILAVFDASSPASLATAAAAAVAAGRALAAELGRASGGAPAPLGVGIVTGRVLAGILGTPTVRLEYTVLGDPVNLASRLCDLALQQGRPTILLDPTTARLVAGEGIACQPLGQTRVKGKAKEVNVFRLQAD